MNSFDDSLSRLLARRERRALLKRTSSPLSPDPALTYGIATIKIVTEEQIQAIAFGSLDSPPSVIVRLNPIGRDVTDLTPFAEFLNGVAQRTVEGDESVRLWIPHAATLESIDILGHRYASNPNAPDPIRRMGQICRIIGHEATIPGQQLVANAVVLMQEQIVTGLVPIEEGHLGAMLAWTDPAIADPLTEARARIRIPASGVLPNTPDRPDDDRIDRLRRDMKSARGRYRAALEREIGDILRAAVLREWQLLVDARRAFLSLGLTTTGLKDLEKDTHKRVQKLLGLDAFYPARSPDRLATQLDIMEFGKQKSEVAALENDVFLRDRAVRSGHIVRGVVSVVRQARPGFKPCDIEVDTDQGMIRFRPDDKIRIVGSNVSGIVRAFTATPAGGTRICINIDSGVRSREILATGTRVELMQAAYGFVDHCAMREVREQQPWVVFGDAAPALPLGTSPGSPLALARAARR